MLDTRWLVAMMAFKNQLNNNSAYLLWGGQQNVKKNLVHGRYWMISSNDDF